jgi:hypothetical protein
MCPYVVLDQTLTPRKEVPQHLSHKPFYAIPYEAFDGIYAGDSDTFFLSVGTAQYDSNSISAKAMRFSKGRWSRQAEEVPIHRLIDMTILSAKALFGAQDESLHFLSGTFENQKDDISICREQRTNFEKEAFEKFFISNNKLLKNRLNSLADVLNDLRDNGRL